MKIFPLETILGDKQNVARYNNKKLKSLRNCWQNQNFDGYIEMILSFILSTSVILSYLSSYLICYLTIGCYKLWKLMEKL